MIPSSKRKTSAGRGRALSRGTRSRLLLGLFVALALGLVYSFLLEPQWPRVRETSLVLEDLPAELDGLTVLLLSDLHLGLWPGSRNLARAVDVASATSPDLILLAGDAVNSRPADLDRGLSLLRKLASLSNVYAVLGNHDVQADGDWVAADLARVGIRVLRDEAIPLAAGGGRFWLVGVEDTGYVARSPERLGLLWSRKRDTFARLLEGIPEAETRLLLVHNPDFTAVLPEGRIDLALAGHTHGGQVRLPLIGALWVPSAFGQRFGGGLEPGDPPLYVTRGLGCVTLPVRFLCRPEITILHLRAD